MVVVKSERIDCFGYAGKFEAITVSTSKALGEYGLFMLATLKLAIQIYLMSIDDESRYYPSTARKV